METFFKDFSLQRKTLTATGKYVDLACPMLIVNYLINKKLSN